LVDGAEMAAQQKIGIPKHHNKRRLEFVCRRNQREGGWLNFLMAAP
jgi:hypothetical protein